MSESFAWNGMISKQTFLKHLPPVEMKKHLQDVTIVGDDNMQMKAHKLVLSASSKYFREIFRNNPSPNLVLCMEGIGSTKLTQILDYIYNGELALFQEDLDEFLTTAKRFKLEGLLETKDEIPPSFRDQQHEQEQEEFTTYNHEATLNDYNIIPEKF